MTINPENSAKSHLTLGRFPCIDRKENWRVFPEILSHWITHIKDIKDYLSHLTDLDQKKQLRKRKKQDEKSISRPQKRKATDTDSESITEDSEVEVESYDSQRTLRMTSSTMQWWGIGVRPRLKGERAGKNVTYICPLSTSCYQNGQMTGCWKGIFSLETGYKYSYIS